MTWPIQDAKARFSELVETTLAEGPQVVTKRGIEAVVVVPIDEWKRLKARSPRSLKELLLAPEARFDFPLPARSKARLRAAVDFSTGDYK